MCKLNILILTLLRNITLFYKFWLQIFLQFPTVCSICYRNVWFLLCCPITISVILWYPKVSIEIISLLFNSISIVNVFHFRSNFNLPDYIFSIRFSYNIFLSLLSLIVQCLIVSINIIYVFLIFRIVV